MSTENKKSYYVYELWNPLTNTLFYIGKGTRTYCKTKDKGLL